MTVRRVWIFEKFYDPRWQQRLWRGDHFRLRGDLHHLAGGMKVMTTDDILKMCDRALRLAEAALNEKEQRIVDLAYEKRQLEKALLERAQSGKDSND